MQIWMGNTVKHYNGKKDKRKALKINPENLHGVYVIHKCLQPVEMKFTADTRIPMSALSHISDVKRNTTLRHPPSTFYLATAYHSHRLSVIVGKANYKFCPVSPQISELLISIFPFTLSQFG